MRLTAKEEKIKTRRKKDQFEKYINNFYRIYQCYPSMRQIQEGLNIPSLSTVSRYVHMLIDEGRIAQPDSSHRNRLLKGSMLFSFDSTPQRKCIRTSDGSILYLDCQVIQRDNGSLDVQVSGIVDLSRCKRNVAQVISCANAEG